MICVYCLSVCNSAEIDSFEEKLFGILRITYICGANEMVTYLSCLKDSVRHVHIDTNWIIEDWNIFGV